MEKALKRIDYFDQIVIINSNDNLYLIEFISLTDYRKWIVESFLIEINFFL